MSNPFMWSLVDGVGECGREKSWESHQETVEQAVGSSVGQTETWMDLEEFELKSRKDKGESQAGMQACYPSYSAWDTW